MARPKGSTKKNTAKNNKKENINSVVNNINKKIKGVSEINPEVEDLLSKMVDGVVEEHINGETKPEEKEANVITVNENDAEEVVKEEQEETIKKTINKKPKKEVTYEEMFGYHWMGQIYDF